MLQGEEMRAGKSLKILHLLSQRPDSTGSGIYLRAMLREAAAHNHENFLVAGIQAGRSVDCDGIEEKRCRFVKFGTADLPFQIVGMSDVMPYESTRFRDLSRDDLHGYERAFSGIIKEAVTAFAPDIIHSHHLWIMTSLTRQLFPDIPMVATCHGSDLRQFQNCPHLQERVLPGCRRLDAVMALCGAQKEEIARLYKLPPERVIVVGAGYDDALFTAGPKPRPDPVQLVYAGKLSKAKGVPWLLQALATVASPPWQLHLVGGGSGAEKDYCLMLAGHLGKRVIVHGAVAQKELAGIMRKAHILVLPSFYEGLPLVVLEGLASGCRIVATGLPGVNELVGDDQADFISLVKTPRLHATDRPHAEDELVFARELAQALQSQIHAASRRPAPDLSPIRNILATFSWRGVFSRVRQVYCRVMISRHG
jgi:glycosyltransferase involved in cell wall biosynthesis